VIQTRMLKVFERLAGWPETSGAKPLTGCLVGHYRIRTGDYRVRFRVRGGQAAIVMVERMGHRENVYDG